jgi:hypothetical protein
MLVRALLRRGHFKARGQLRERVGSFIAYCNATMAKPFRWTMKGKPLAASRGQEGPDLRRRVLMTRPADPGCRRHAKGQDCRLDLDRPTLDQKRGGMHRPRKG